MAFIAIVVGTLITLSLPVVASLLDAWLYVPASSTQFEPDCVVVLAGGYDVGARPELDTLSSSTAGRVVGGVAYWKKHPHARFIVTGSLPKSGRSDGRTAELMADLAICHGVPRGVIVREPTALTTRDHPRAVLRLPGVDRDTPLAIVTSAIHMRRAAIEFRKYFTRVECEPLERGNMLANARTWWPDAGAIWQSTDAIHEWIGIVVYRVTSPRSAARTSE